jgi:hypothetical protein
LLNGIDLAASEKVIQPSHSIPTIAVGLDDESMLATMIAAAVLLRQQIYQKLVSLIL